MPQQECNVTLIYPCFRQRDITNEAKRLPIKQRKFGFIKRVDKGRITTPKDFES